MAGAFALFEVLGIPTTFNLSASIFLPGHFQFLDFNIIEHIEGGNIIPELKSAKPGDWIVNEGGISYFNPERIEGNLEAHKVRIGHDKIFYEERSLYLTKAMKKSGEDNDQFLKDLFGKIKYHFVNQNRFANFGAFPEHPKIIYIGGILVEENENIDITTVKNFSRFPLVYVSFGTVSVQSGMTVEDIKFMMGVFHGYQYRYKFKVRTGKECKPEKRGNLEVTNDFLPQQEILFHSNTKLFISHCGQNSLTEAIYAGVPLICIPNSGDQFYNSSLVEHLGIGKYVLLTFKDEKGNDQRNGNFESDFQNALSDILLYRMLVKMKIIFIFENFY
uniref:UDP-glucuronosyltransferase n=1 Tax=Meloidogyne enterolobii TaxID=390850 RepID=A0A6V7UDJ9_MELEN|nr:unnamed protein product [Meloidogyne enterolobii]